MFNVNTQHVHTAVSVNIVLLQSKYKNLTTEDANLKKHKKVHNKIINCSVLILLSKKGLFIVYIYCFLKYLSSNRKFKKKTVKLFL